MAKSPRTTAHLTDAENAFIEREARAVGMEPSRFAEMISRLALEQGIIRGKSRGRAQGCGKS